MKGKLIRLVQIFIAVAALAILGWSTYAFVHYLRTSSTFEVKALTVSGVSGPLKRVGEDQIIGQAQFEVGTNVFLVDMEKIRQRVERLRWVRYAMVQRVLPDQIIIKVIEREPIGLARIRGEVFHFDVDAAILDVDPVSMASFPILDGLRRNDPEGNLAKVEIYQRVVDEIGQTELSEISIGNNREVTVVSASDPMLVSLGSANFRARWTTYLQLKTQIHQRYPQAVRVDLRFKNQVIVRMKDDDTSGEQLVWEGVKKAL
jgi:cell division protein FtsQ